MFTSNLKIKGQSYGSQWFWPWHSCCYQMDWSEYFRNRWSPWISIHSSLTVYPQWCEKQKTSSELQTLFLMRLAKLCQADKKATVSQINTFYNNGEQKKHLAQLLEQQKITSGSTPKMMLQCAHVPLKVDRWKLTGVYFQSSVVHSWWACAHEWNGPQVNILYGV